MFIPDPGSRILIFTHPGSRIPDLGSRIQRQQQNRGVKKKFVVITFYLATNFTQLHIILVLMCWRKKFGPIFKELTFYPKIVNKLSKIWIWDPGSGIPDPGSGKNLFRIPDPGSRGQKGTDPGSRIRIRNTVFNRGDFFIFFIFCTLSTLLHLPPLRFRWVGGCWDRTQDCCDYGIQVWTSLMPIIQPWFIRYSLLNFLYVLSSYFRLF
jgi:hypothetical protein